MTERSPNSRAVATDDRPHSEIVREAERILESAASRSVLLRVMGGVAIRLHASGPMNAAVTREYHDIDLVSLPGSAGDVSRLLSELGYEENSRFSTLHAGRRGLFYDTHNKRKLDLFLGEFEMCHTIPITDRLQLDPTTIPLAELLLTKLQIVQLNAKDVRDIVALLLDHDVADHDDDTINGQHIAKLCSDDWGLWRTCKQTIPRVGADLDNLGLMPNEKATVGERLDLIWSEIKRAPKSRRWRLRDRVGDRVRWYLEPEEPE
jgi:hypothetical protein